MKGCSYEAQISHTRTNSKKKFREADAAIASGSTIRQVLFSANTQLKKDNKRLDEFTAKIIKIDETLKDITIQVENVINFMAKGSINNEAAKKKIENLEKQEAKLKKE